METDRRKLRGAVGGLWDLGAVVSSRVRGTVHVAREGKSRMLRGIREIRCCVDIYTVIPRLTSDHANELFG
jgi:hypothetical protein